ncbi:hypothetical protein BJV82DRAFT_617543 [Fennellomyces sp. T-0311]|nr:hypothetical protein BJV82DRAFT_617543 [Fennellomyces sp. T-0311]
MADWYHPVLFIQIRRGRIFFVFLISSIFSCFIVMVFLNRVLLYFLRFLWLLSSCIYISSFLLSWNAFFRFCP